MNSKVLQHGTYTPYSMILSLQYGLLTLLTISPYSILVGIKEYNKQNLKLLK